MMRIAEGLLLFLLCIAFVIFNRFAAEEGLKWRPPWWVTWKYDLLLARIVVVTAGVVLGVLGLLIGFGYMK
jgi:hypothetical protein